ncbi:MAG: hypothetical protein ACR2JQ_05035, partial [Mycobacteriales bacterium]
TGRLPAGGAHRRQPTGRGRRAGLIAVLLVLVVGAGGAAVWRFGVHRGPSSAQQQTRQYIRSVCAAVTAWQDRVSGLNATFATAFPPADAATGQRLAAGYFTTASGRTSGLITALPADVPDTTSGGSAYASRVRNAALAAQTWFAQRASQVLALDPGEPALSAVSLRALTSHTTRPLGDVAAAVVKDPGSAQLRAAITTVPACRAVRRAPG